MPEKYIYNGKIMKRADIEEAANQSKLDVNTYLQKAGIKVVNDNYNYNGKTVSAEDVLEAANQSKLGFDDYVQKAGFSAIPDVKKKAGGNASLYGANPFDYNSNGQSKSQENKWLRPIQTEEENRYETEVAKKKNAVNDFSQRLKGEYVFRNTPAGWDWVVSDFSSKDTDKRNPVDLNSLQNGDILDVRNVQKAPNINPKLKSPTGYLVATPKGWIPVAKPDFDVKQLPEVKIRSRTYKPTDKETVSKFVEDNYKDDDKFIQYLNVVKKRNNGSDRMSEHLSQYPVLAEYVSKQANDHPDQMRTAEGQYNIYINAVSEKFLSEESVFDKSKRPQLDKAEFIKYNRLMESHQPFFDEMKGLLVSMKEYSERVKVLERTKDTNEQAAKKYEELISKITENNRRLKEIGDKVSPITEYFDRPDVAEAIALMDKGETLIAGAYGLFPKYSKQLDEEQKRRLSDSDSFSIVRSLLRGTMDVLVGLASIGAKYSPAGVSMPGLDFRVDEMVDKYKNWARAELTTPDRTGHGVVGDIKNVLDQTAALIPQMIPTAKLSKVSNLLELLPVGAVAFTDAHNQALSEGYDSDMASIYGATSALVQAIPEKMFADKTLLSSFKPSRELLEKGIKNFAGKEYREMLGKDVSDFIKNNIIRSIPEETLKQLSEEEVSMITQPILNMVYNHFTGTGFDESLPEFKDHLYTLGSLVMLTSGLKGAAATSIKGRSNSDKYGNYLLSMAAKGDYNFAMSVIDNARNDENANHEFLDQIESGITGIASINFPKGTTPEQKVLLQKQMSEKNRLEDEFKNADEVFASVAKNKIAETEKEIIHIIEDPGYAKKSVLEMTEGVEDDITKHRDKEEILSETGRASAGIEDINIRSYFLSNPEMGLAEVAQQLHGTTGEAETANRLYGSKLSDLALELYPTKESADKAMAELKSSSKDVSGVEGGDVVKKSDAEIENRMTEIQDKGNKSTEMEDREFDALEKEMQKRERSIVFNVPLSEAKAGIDALMKKEKEMPNGWGAFIEKRDASESKSVIDNYLSPKEISDNQLKKDFKDALMGRPATWYADGLKLRESMKEAANRGININDMLKEAESEFTKEGYDIKTAKEMVAYYLKPVFEGSKKVNEKQIAEQSTKVEEQGDLAVSGKGVTSGNEGKGQNISTKENKGTSDSPQPSGEEGPEKLQKRYERVIGEADLTDPVDIVLNHFASGGKIHSNSIAELFGGKDPRINQRTSTENERRAKISILGKDAKSIDDLAHSLWESDPTGKYDTQDYKNAIESVLLGYNSKSSMQQALADKYDLESAYEKYAQQKFGQEAIDIVENLSEAEIDEILRLEADEKAQQELENYLDNLPKSKTESKIQKLEQEREGEIREALKPELEIKFKTADDIKGMAKGNPKEFKRIAKEQSGIKKKFKQLESIIDCLWAKN